MEQLNRPFFCQN